MLLHAIICYTYKLNFSKWYIPRKKLKLTEVIPIYKSGDKTNIDNYLPILLPILNKNFEKSISTRLEKFLENNNIFTDNQHGFRKITPPSFPYYNL